MKIHLLVLVGLVLSCLVNFVLAESGEAFTDPAKAGPDFAVQGEYKGQLAQGDQTTVAGMQVIAKGDGKFEVVGLEDGLPGDGWNRSKHKKSGTGEWDQKAVKIKGPNGIGVIEDGKLSLFSADGKQLGTLEKMERKSPTLGAKPPEGAIVLFNGSNADEFPGAKMTEDKSLLAGATSNREFTDFVLHLEFRTPFMPKSSGQGRGNSGVYLQNRYEIQVLDSFGLDGKSNECGGLYSLKEPAVNMCFPPLSWQTYDIDFTAARFEGDKKVKNARATIKHNGVVIYDDTEIPGITPEGAKNEAPGRGPFKLQWHDNPVTYRNIWVVEKK
jgi:hypothetical protein